MSRHRLKQNWSRKTQGERLNLWLTTSTYHSLKEFCDREELTPSLAKQPIEPLDGARKRTNRVSGCTQRQEQTI